MSSSESEQDDDEPLLVAGEQPAASSAADDHRLGTTVVDETKTWSELGVTEVLCESCVKCGWTRPTRMQIAALPHAFAGRDIIGLAETGSGKT